jgi:hypothetical protein
VIGTVTVGVRTVRNRFSTDSLLPEVLAGGLVGYLGVTYLMLKDPRYSLPALVYVAVLGTFWLPSLRRRSWRIAAIAVVMGFAAINFVGMSTGLGGTRRIAISLPGAELGGLVDPGQLAIYQDQGWPFGPPEQDGNVPTLLKRLRALGITQIAVDGSTVNAPDLNLTGIQPYAIMDGMAVAGISSPTPGSAYLLLHAPRPGDPPPCGRMDSGQGIYIIRGRTTGLDTLTLRDAANPRQQYQFMCPGRPPVTWPPLRG